MLALKTVLEVDHDTNTVLHATGEQIAKVSLNAVVHDTQKYRAEKITECLVSQEDTA